MKSVLVIAIESAPLVAKLVPKPPAAR